MKKIILTGGGSAGHVTPNLALVPELRKRGYEILYVGQTGGMEEPIVTNAGLEYRGISAGKLRRYLDWRNLLTPFQVLKGYCQSRRIIRRYQPDVVFAKGGFVSAPLVWAAKRAKVPALIHESDLTPGLANKLCFSSASRILCNFPETLEYLPKDRSLVSGCPIREELRQGSREAGLRFTGLPGRKPVLLVMGGSLGAMSLNGYVHRLLDTLLEEFEIVHLCGKGHLDPELSREGYVQFEYVDEEMKDIFALADVVLSRAGANAICELLALEKPALLVPYPKGGSRGDQILNARSFEKQGFALVLEEEEITTDSVLLDGLHRLLARRDELIAAMAASPQKDAVGRICDEIAKL